MRGQERVLVEQRGEHRPQLVRRNDGQQQPTGVPGAADPPVQDLVPALPLHPAGEPLAEPP